MRSPQRTLEKPIRVGIAAGAISSVLSSLVSLPLHSPNDSLFNTATVTLGALMTGLAAGVAWRVLAGFPRRTLLFVVLWAAGFGLSVAISVAGEASFGRSLPFVVPLSAIVFVATGLMMVMPAGRAIVARWWVAPLVLVVALGLGFGLAGQGDAESGRLELPARDAFR